MDNRDATEKSRILTVACVTSQSRNDDNPRKHFPVLQEGCGQSYLSDMSLPRLIGYTSQVVLSLRIIAVGNHPSSSREGGACSALLDDLNEAMTPRIESPKGSAKHRMLQVPEFSSASTSI